MNPPRNLFCCGLYSSSWLLSFVHRLLAWILMKQELGQGLESKWVTEMSPGRKSKPVESETQEREANDRRRSVHAAASCSTEARPTNGIARISSGNCPWEGQESWGVYPSISNWGSSNPAAWGLPWVLTESSDREAERCGVCSGGSCPCTGGCHIAFRGSSEVVQGDEGIGSIPYTTAPIGGQFPLKDWQDNTVLCVHNTITS